MRVQGLGTNEFKQSYWLKAFKLVPRSSDEGPKPKSGKLTLNPHGTYVGGKINWLGPKNSAKNRAPALKNQESG
jgi:hypothetical protein